MALVRGKDERRATPATFRQRRAQGRARWVIENDVVAVEHLLEVAKLLPVGVEHTAADVQAALNRLIDIHIADER